MFTLKITRSLMCMLALAGVSTAQSALAGGIPVKKGKYVLALSFSYFRSDKLWDEKGKTVNYVNDGYFSSSSVSFSGEYGLARRVTLVASLPYVMNDFVQQTNITSVNGLGDAELGLRYYLGNIKFKYHFGLQGAAVLPLYTNNNLGFGTGGVDVKLVGSGAEKSGSKTYNFSAEAGVRQYFSDSGPFQFKYGGSAGVSFNNQNQFTLGVSGALSTSIDKQVNSNIVLNKDYSYTLASFSYGHTFTPSFSLFGGVNQFLVGRSTGKGTSYSLTVITKL